MRGDIRFLDVPEPVLAFVRGSGNDAILCAFNLGNGQVALDLPAEVVGEPLAGHGLPGDVDGQRIRLPRHGGLFARVHDVDRRAG
jgi:alpha-glucosidase